MQARGTKRVVDAAAPTGRDQFVWDTDVKGFGLKVTPIGRKVYLLQTRVGGRLRRYTIGTHGSPWTPDAARSEALRLLGLIHQGADPAEEQSVARADLTMSDLCRLYLAEGCEGKKPSTVAIDRSRVSRHIVPLLGKKRVREITRADVERFMADVAAGKTAVDERTRQRGRAIVTGGRGTATRTMGLLGAILQFAVGRGLRTEIRPTGSGDTRIAGSNASSPRPNLPAWQALYAGPRSGATTPMLLRRSGSFFSPVRAKARYSVCAGTGLMSSEPV